MELGRPHHAADCLQLAAQRGPANVDVLYYLAQAEYGAGRYAEAGNAAERVLAIDASHQASRQLLAQLAASQPTSSRNAVRASFQSRVFAGIWRRRPRRCKFSRSVGDENATSRRNSATAFPATVFVNGIIETVPRLICRGAFYDVCFCGSLPSIVTSRPNSAPTCLRRIPACPRPRPSPPNRSSIDGPPLARNGAAVRTPPVCQQLRRAVARSGRAGPRHRRLQSAAPPPLHHVRRNAGGDQIAGLLAVA